MIIREKTIWTPDNSFLLEYRARAETGEIVIGQELWQELDNLAEDFHNERYFYDVEAARLRMDFMENCIRLTKSPFYNKPGATFSVLLSPHTVQVIFSIPSSVQLASSTIVPASQLCSVFGMVSCA